MIKVFETERLILRHWELDDVQRLFEIGSDADVMFRIGDGKPYESIKQAEKFLNWAKNYQKENGFCRWAVIEKASGKTIGSCGFVKLYGDDIDLGYLFAKDYWGKGFATEAVKGSVKYGFEKLGFSKIVALTDIDHIETHRVLEKSGFTKRGVEKIYIDEDLVFEIKNQSKTDL